LPKAIEVGSPRENNKITKLVNTNISFHIDLDRHNHVINSFNLGFRNSIQVPFQGIEIRHDLSYDLSRKDNIVQYNNYWTGYAHIGETDNRTEEGSYPHSNLPFTFSDFSLNPYITHLLELLLNILNKLKLPMIIYSTGGEWHDLKLNHTVLFYQAWDRNEIRIDSKGKDIIIYYPLFHKSYRLNGNIRLLSLFIKDKITLIINNNINDIRDYDFVSVKTQYKKPYSYTCNPVSACGGGYCTSNSLISYDFDLFNSYIQKYGNVYGMDEIYLINYPLNVYIPSLTPIYHSKYISYPIDLTIYSSASLELLYKIDYMDQSVCDLLLNPHFPYLFNRQNGKYEILNWSNPVNDHHVSHLLENPLDFRQSHIS